MKYGKSEENVHNLSIKAQSYNSITFSACGSSERAADVCISYSEVAVLSCLLQLTAWNNLITPPRRRAFRQPALTPAINVAHTFYTHKHTLGSAGVDLIQA